MSERPWAGCDHEVSGAAPRAAEPPGADEMSDAPLLEHLYTVGSLENVDDGFRFQVKNRLFDATLVAVDRLVVDGDEVELDRVVARAR